jgi:hypothetical protein
MALQLDEYRAKLINKILFASSRQLVKGFIDDTLNSMEQNKVNKHIIARFTGKVINDLSSFSPMKKEAQQWDNIKVAKILLNRIWIQLNQQLIKPE